MSEFMQTLEKAAQSIRQESQVASKEMAQNQHKATIAILAGVDLFMRFVTRNSHDFSVRVSHIYMYIIYIALTKTLIRIHI